LVQFLGVNIEIYREPRSFMTYLPISPAYVTSTITAPAEKSHPIEIFNESWKILNNPYMKIHLNKINIWIYYLP